MPILIDSDILIEISRKRNLELFKRWTDLSDSEEILLVSPLSIAELWHGARPNEHRETEAMLDSLQCIFVIQKTGNLAGQFLNRYSKSHNLAIADAFIAAGAVLEHARLWTRNRKHYPMPELSFY